MASGWPTIAGVGLTSVLLLHFGLHEEGVVQLGTRVVLKIIETPVGLGIEFVQMPNPLLDRREPEAVSRVNGKGIERDEHLARDAINDDRKASVAAFLGADCLSEAHFTDTIFFAGLLVRPAVSWQQHRRDKPDSSR